MATHTKTTKRKMLQVDFSDVVEILKRDARQETAPTWLRGTIFVLQGNNPNYRASLTVENQLRNNQLNTKLCTVWSLSYRKCNELSHTHVKIPIRSFMYGQSLTPTTFYSQDDYSVDEMVIHPWGLHV